MPRERWSRSQYAPPCTTHSEPPGKRWSDVVQDDDRYFAQCYGVGDREGGRSRQRSHACGCTGRLFPLRPMPPCTVATRFVIACRMIGPSGHQAIGPSGQRAIEPSGHRAIGPSDGCKTGAHARRRSSRAGTAESSAACKRRHFAADPVHPTARCGGARRVCAAAAREH